MWPSIFDWLVIKMFLILLTLLLLTMWLWDLKHSIKMPPGPFQWPLLGCLPQMALHAKDPLAYLKNLGKKYNGLFSLKMGNYHAVYISDFEVMKEALVKQADCFSDRPNDFYAFNLALTHNGQTGILTGSGQKWKVLRRFAIVTMRDMGVGKKSLEERIHTEAESCTKEMAKHAGKPCDHSSSVGMAVTNIICSIVFGDRYEYGDQVFSSILHHMNAYVTGMNIFSPINTLRPLQKLPQSKQMKEWMGHKEAMTGIVLKELVAHKTTFDQDVIRDLIDLCLQKQKEDSGNNVLNDDTLCAVIFELFLAGTETTATTLKWAILYLATHPDIQHKCHKEIDTVLGNKLPNMADRPKLPFVDATIAEIQRLSNIIPISIVHAAAYDTTLAGYSIPKGTWVLPMLYTVNGDTKGWEDPDVFRPERFLNENGECKRPENLVPFGIGPRLCAGEPLARMELFIFFTVFLQKFTFSKCAPDQDVDLTPHLGVTLSPKPQDIMIDIR